MKLQIKNLVIPTKEVSVIGFKDTITIYPIGGFALIKLKELASDLQGDEENPQKQEECVRLALKWGCKCNDEEVQFLIDNALISSIQLTKEIIEFSSEYNDNNFKESSLAKKKSKK